MGFESWFKFTSKKEEEKQQHEYEAWSFPYGPEQRATVERLLRELVPQENAQLALMLYLTGRDTYRDKKERFNGDKTACRTALHKLLARQLRGRYAQELPLFEALIFADANASSAEDYPAAEALRQRAAELEAAWRAARPEKGR